MLALIPRLGEGLWRGHAFQGRCQPGRRAVLEEKTDRLTLEIIPRMGRFLKRRRARFEQLTPVNSVDYIEVYLSVDPGDGLSSSV
jgi:hypothetical protein